MPQPIRIKIPEKTVEHRWICPGCNTVMDVPCHQNTGSYTCEDCKRFATFEGTFLVVTPDLIKRMQKQIEANNRHAAKAIANLKKLKNV